MHTYRPLGLTVSTRLRVKCNPQARAATPRAPMACLVTVTLCGPLSVLLLQRRGQQSLPPRAYSLYFLSVRAPGVVSIIRFRTRADSIITIVAVILVVKVNFRNRALSVA